MTFFHLISQKKIYPWLNVSFWSSFPLLSFSRHSLYGKNNVVLLIVCFSTFPLALCRYRYAPPDSETPQISFAAHLAGVVAGLTFGLVILKNYEQKLSERRVWWLTLLVLFILSFTAFLYQRLRPNPALTLFCVGHRCPPPNSWPHKAAISFIMDIYNMM